MTDGGPAFPIRFRYERSDGAIVTHEADGMSLRDYFAAKAMQAHAAHFGTNPEAEGRKVLATFAYQIADAMLAARGDARSGEVKSSP